jgi:archaellum component FlaF (FlaF/FlaG flagellin family)
MGFSLVAATAVIGVSLFVAAEILTGSLLPVMKGINNSYDEMKDRMIYQIQTDINITSVTTQPNGVNYDHNITVENTGSITLKTSDFTILINGVSQTFTCNKPYLYPKKVAYFTVVNLPGAGTKRLKVITDNGISSYYEYTIP